MHYSLTMWGPRTEDMLLTPSSVSHPERLPFRSGGLAHHISFPADTYGCYSGPLKSGWASDSSPLRWGWMWCPQFQGGPSQMRGTLSPVGPDAKNLGMILSLSKIKPWDRMRRRLTPDLSLGRLSEPSKKDMRKMPSSCASDWHLGTFCHEQAVIPLTSPWG